MPVRNEPRTSGALQSLHAFGLSAFVKTVKLYHQIAGFNRDLEIDLQLRLHVGQTATTGMLPKAGLVLQVRQLSTALRERVRASHDYPLVRELRLTFHAVQFYGRVRLFRIAAGQAWFALKIIPIEIDEGPKPLVQPSIGMRAQ
eukprot:scaffold1146_cov399-Prasinococcus_capsulatus_cf.AAC.49